MITLNSIAQKVSGLIVNEKKEKIAKAKIQVIEFPSIVVETNNKGYFEFEKPKSIENISLRVNALEYQPTKVKLGKVLRDTQIQIIMDYKQGTADSTLIIADRKTNGMVKVDIRKFRQLPNPSQSFEGALRFFGGVSANDELSSQYNVRGGNFDENLVYINGIEIYRPQLFRTGQQEGLSMINSQMVENVAFSAGGFQAKYGDKMSSVLDITYKRPSSFGGSASLGLLGGELNFDFASKDQKFTALVGARYRDNGYLLGNLDVQGDYRPSFADLQTYVAYDVSPKLVISALGYYGRNRFFVKPISQQTVFGTFSEALRLDVFFEGQEIMQTDVGLAAITATYQLSENSILSLKSSIYNANEQENFDVIGAYSLNALETGNSSSTEVGEASYNLGVGAYLDHARNVFSANIYNIKLQGNHKEGKQLEMEWGIRHQRENIFDRVDEYKYFDSADYSIPTGRDPNTVEVQEYLYNRYENAWSRYEGYLQNSFTLDDEKNAYLTLGLRANHWDFTKYTAISPRVQFYYSPFVQMKPLEDSTKKRIQLDTRTVIFSVKGGVYQQQPFFREIRLPDGQILPGGLEPQKSNQIVIGAESGLSVFSKPFTGKVEFYYKDYSKLIPYSIQNVRIRYLPNQESSGNAMGVDFTMNGEFIRDFPSFLSLSIMKTAENIVGDTGISIIVDENGNQIETEYEVGNIPRPADQRFTFSLFFQDFFPNNPKMRVNLNTVFGTGLPYGPPTLERWREVLRTRPYRRVDIGFSKQLLPSKKSVGLNQKNSLWLNLEIFNMFDINNAVAFLWVQDINGTQYAVPRNLTRRRFNLRLDWRF